MSNPDHCPSSPTGKHKPDWGTVTIDDDGDDHYLDVVCSHCGRSGCVGKATTLTEDISW